MSLYKGEGALAERCAIAAKLNAPLIRALRKPRHVDDKPDWAPMQELFDAGFSCDPVTGMPVFDPDACAPALLEALWRSYCGVADTINTRVLGKTNEALGVLQTELVKHTSGSTTGAGETLKRPRSQRADRDDAEPRDLMTSYAGEDGNCTMDVEDGVRQLGVSERPAGRAQRLRGGGGTSVAIPQGGARGEGVLHQPDLTDFIGSCSQCGSGEYHCNVCGVCYCDICTPSGCHGAAPDGPRADGNLDAPPLSSSPPPSPPPSPPSDYTLQCKPLSTGTALCVVDRFLDGVRVATACKKRIWCHHTGSAAPKASMARWVSGGDEQDDCEWDDAAGVEWHGLADTRCAKVGASVEGPKELHKGGALDVAQYCSKYMSIIDEDSRK